MDDLEIHIIPWLKDKQLEKTYQSLLNSEERKKTVKYSQPRETIAQSYYN